MSRKILIVGPSWVGDMVMAQSLCIDLKRQYPSCELHMMAPAWSAALTDCMPEVDGLISVDFKHGKLDLKHRIEVARNVAAMMFDQAIILPNSLKSSLVPALARIPHRTGWRGEQRYGLINDMRRLDKLRWPMTVQRFIALGRAKAAEPLDISHVPQPKLKVDVNAVQSTLNDFQLSTAKPRLVLCPGAEFGESKQWPARYYTAVAQHFLQKSWQVWLLGSTKDEAICAEIEASVEGDCVSLAGKTTLPQAVDLLSCANLVVSNDSGLMHIGAALARPLVAVYGSTDPGHTPPLGDRYAIARLDLDCSPCFKRECPLEHLNCLNQLAPQTVIDLSESLLEKVN